MFRQAIQTHTNPLRQRVVSKLTQNRRFATNNNTAAPNGEKITQEVKADATKTAAETTTTPTPPAPPAPQAPQAPVVDEFAHIKPIDGPFVPPVKKPTPPEAPLKTDATTATKNNNNENTININEFPQFIQNHLQGTGGNGRSRFFMQEFHSGPDGKGVTSTYKGSFSPDRGLKLKHVSEQHHGQQQPPTVTTKLFRSEPTTSQITAKELPAIEQQPNLQLPKLNQNAAIGKKPLSEAGLTAEGTPLAEVPVKKTTQQLPRHRSEAEFETELESEFLSEMEHPLMGYLEHSADPYRHRSLFVDPFFDNSRHLGRRFNHELEHEFNPRKLRQLAQGKKPAQQEPTKQQRANDTEDELFEGFLDDFFAPTSRLAKQTQQRVGSSELSTAASKALEKQAAETAEAIRIAQEKAAAFNKAVAKEQAAAIEQAAIAKRNVEKVAEAAKATSVSQQRQAVNNQPKNVEFEYEDPYEFLSDLFGPSISNNLRRGPGKYGREPQHHHRQPQHHERAAQQTAHHQHNAPAQQHAHQHNAPAQQQGQQAHAQQQQQQQQVHPQPQQQQQFHHQQPQHQQPQHQHPQQPNVPSVAPVAPVPQAPANPGYYHAHQGFTPEGFHNWAHDLHRDMGQFHNRANQLESLTRRLREEKRAHKAAQRYHQQQQQAQDHLNNFFSPFSTPFGSHPFHTPSHPMSPFGAHHSIGSFPGFGFGRGGYPGSGFYF